MSVPLFADFAVEADLCARASHDLRRLVDVVLLTFQVRGVVFFVEWADLTGVIEFDSEVHPVFHVLEKYHLVDFLVLVGFRSIFTFRNGRLHVLVLMRFLVYVRCACRISLFAAKCIQRQGKCTR